MGHDIAVREPYSETTPELDFRAAASGKVVARFLFGAACLIPLPFSQFRSTVLFLRRSDPLSVPIDPSGEYRADQSSPRRWSEV
jgi:hypothetical protein